MSLTMTMTGLGRSFITGYQLLPIRIYILDQLHPLSGHSLEVERNEGLFHPRGRFLVISLH